MPASRQAVVPLASLLIALGTASGCSVLTSFAEYRFRADAGARDGGEPNDGSDSRRDVGPRYDAGLRDASPDADEPDSARADAGAEGWSACVGCTATYCSCARYCRSVGSECAELCTSLGNPNHGARAWPLATGACTGDPTGGTTCTFPWNDAVGDAPRWQCCCI